MLFDRWLRALDSALASFGATRKVALPLGNAKSSARLLCPPDALPRVSAVGTLPTYVTQLLFLAPTQVQLLLARPLALASKSTPVPGSQCVPVDELRSTINGVDHAPHRTRVDAAMC